MAQREHVQGIGSNHWEDDTIALAYLRDRLRQFVAEREWGQFHSPKNLAIALSVEAGELLEHFQWVSELESGSLPPIKLNGIGEEMADVLSCLIRLADVLGVDLIQGGEKKIDTNARKYPVEKSRGSAKKYSDR
jgi:dCTP diphosphatase